MKTGIPDFLPVEMNITTLHVRNRKFVIKKFSFIFNYILS